MGHDVVEETPVPEVDGLHIYVHGCVIREDLNLLAVEKRQQCMAGLADHAQFQHVDVHTRFPGKPPPLHGPIATLTRKASVVRVAMGMEVANEVPWSTLVASFYQVSDVQTHLGTAKAMSRRSTWGLQIERSHSCRQRIWRCTCSVT